MHDRLAREPCRIGEQEARREIVGRVDDEVARPHEVERVRRQRATFNRLDLDAELPQVVAERGELRPPDVGLFEQDLAMEVRRFDAVVVTYDETSNAGFRERDRDGSSDSASPDEEHAGSAQARSASLGRRRLGGRRDRHGTGNLWRRAPRASRRALARASLQRYPNERTLEHAEDLLAFYQAPPSLANQFDDDRVLRSFLARAFPRDVLDDVTPSLREMGELAGGPLYRAQLADRESLPVLTQWDAWGHRVDHIEVTPVWKEAARIAATHGVVATAYERKHGALSRTHQFALAYLFDASTDVYTCPLAMTDGAAATLSFHGGPAKERALPRLLSRDPATAWTSGQWMTERTGGSDVGLSETEAKRDGDAYRLYGTKWFTSATTSQMALTLGRPEGNPPGGRGLALFYVEVRDADGKMNGISINRLKDKLGTRKVPTAELTLDGALAMPVAGLTDGIRNITPMLNVTRTWNAVGALAGMRRGLALARDYAKKRVQFGAPLAEKPLHVDTLAGLEAEFEAAFQLTFKVIDLLGKHETREIGDRDAALLRLLTPIMKLTTGKQAVATLSEVLECFGGAGYIEDTGLPRLYRDAQVLPIWEGTTNVLSLDTLRAIAKEGSLPVLLEEIAARTAEAPIELKGAAETARHAATHAASWLEKTFAADAAAVEAGARRFAMTLGRATELALLVDHASHTAKTDRDPRPSLAAARFAAAGVDLVLDSVPLAAPLAGD